MKAKPEPRVHTFRITTHSHLAGCALSCDGGWGGLRFPSVEAAEHAARSSAAGDQFVIKRTDIRWRERLLTDTSPDWLVAA